MLVWRRSAIQGFTDLNIRSINKQLAGAGFVFCLFAVNNAIANDYLEVIAAAQCADTAMPRLEEWGSRDEFLASAMFAGADAAYRSPTSTFGQWVDVRITDDRVTGISRIASEGITRIELDENCQTSSQATSVFRGKQGQGGAGLTDTQAAMMMAADEHGVFYSWSPHMPLSVSGYAEITDAAKGLGIALIPVLSDHANEDFASSEASLAGMPETAVLRNLSVELIMRDLNIHAPAILIFSGGEFVSPTIPGFRRADDYRKLIQRFLD